MKKAPISAKTMKALSKEATSKEEQKRKEFIKAEKERVQDLLDNPWEQGQLKEEAILAASGKAYDEQEDSFGEEHWAFDGGFLAGIKWYQEQLKNK